MESKEVGGNGAQDRKVTAKAVQMPWFHGKISRAVAEKILVPRKDGLFLVRESTNFPGDYTLCVCFDNRVEHYRIILKVGTGHLGTYLGFLRFFYYTQMLMSTFM